MNRHEGGLLYVDFFYPLKRNVYPPEGLKRRLIRYFLKIHVLS